MLNKHNELCAKIQTEYPDSKIGLTANGELIQESRGWLNWFGGVTVSKRDAHYLHVFLSKLVDDERPLLSSRSVQIIKNHDYDLTVKDMLLFNQELDNSKAYKEHIKSSLEEYMQKINQSAKYSPELEEEIFTILQQSLEIMNIDAHDKETQNELYKSIIQTIMDTYSDHILCQYLASFIIAKNISFTAEKMGREQIIIYLQCLGDQNLKNFNHEDLLNLINSSFFPQLQKLLIKQRSSEHKNDIIAEIKQEIEINNTLSQTFSLQNLDNQQKNAFNIIKNKKLYKDYNENHLCFLLQNKFIDAEIVADFQEYNDEDFDNVLNIKQTYDQLNQIGYKNFIKKETIDQKGNIQESNESFKNLIKDALKRCMIIEDPNEMEEVASYIVNNKMIDEQKYIRNSSGARDDEIFKVINSLVKIKNNQLEHCAFMKNLRLMHIGEDNPQASLVETKKPVDIHIHSFQQLLRTELKELRIDDDNIEEIIQYIIKYDRKNVTTYLKYFKLREKLLTNWLTDYDNSTNSLVLNSYQTQLISTDSPNSQPVNQDTQIVKQSSNQLVTKSPYFADDGNDKKLHYTLKLLDERFDSNRPYATIVSKKVSTFFYNEIKKTPENHQNKEQDLQFMIDFMLSTLDCQDFENTSEEIIEKNLRLIYQLLYNKEIGIMFLLNRNSSNIISNTILKGNDVNMKEKMQKLFMEKKLQMACNLFIKWQMFDKELNNSKVKYFEEWINNEEDELDIDIKIMFHQSPVAELGVPHQSYGKFFIDTSFV